MKHAGTHIATTKYVIAASAGLGDVTSLRSSHGTSLRGIPAASASAPIASHVIIIRHEANPLSVCSVHISLGHER
jgi:hypothetical protein